MTIIVGGEVLKKVKQKEIEKRIVDFRTIWI